MNQVTPKERGHSYAWITRRNAVELRGGKFFPSRSGGVFIFLFSICSITQFASHKAVADIHQEAEGWGLGSLADNMDHVLSCSFGQPPHLSTRRASN
ncbi:unnamed protein product [Periconia digitata]|uniref:Uncharacterized protein n=1 Tax=Periconia digitata TaxID=1303443 RepID=A0A9W4UGM9_9PLEO|nr:unnamed protein product [Periconia digitata]